MPRTIKLFRLISGGAIVILVVIGALKLLLDIVSDNELPLFTSLRELLVFLVIFVSLYVVLDIQMSNYFKIKRLERLLADAGLQSKVRS